MDSNVSHSKILLQHNMTIYHLTDMCSSKYTYISIPNTAYASSWQAIGKKHDMIFFPPSAVKNMRVNMNIYLSVHSIKLLLFEIFMHFQSYFWKLGSLLPFCLPMNQHANLVHWVQHKKGSTETTYDATPVMQCLKTHKIVLSNVIERSNKWNEKRQGRVERTKPRAACCNDQKKYSFCMSC